MVIMATTFYKVIVLSVDVFESKIVDERHFSTKSDANNYKEQIDTTTNFVGVVIRM